MTLIPGVSSAVAADRWRGTRVERARRGWMMLLMLALVLLGAKAAQGVTSSRADEYFILIFDGWLLFLIDF